jgi:hypothetical protein
MTPDRETDVWRTRGGATWRNGGDADVAWIEEATTSGLAITSAIPPVFEAYATLELPGAPDGTGGWSRSAADFDEQRDQDASVVAVLREHTAQQQWWLGFLDTGSAGIVFFDVPKVTLYADWKYVVIEAGPEQAGSWRDDDHWKGVLPDLMFPADRSWLVSTLWDDDWRCIGGSRRLVDALLAHPDLRHRAREVEASAEDATPPGHTAM